MKNNAADTVLRGLAPYGPLEEADCSAILQLCAQPKRMKRDSLLFEKGEDKFCVFLLNGWAKSYQVLSDGQRAITSFHFSGDIVCLPTLLLGGGCESYSTASEAVFCRVARPAMDQLLERRPLIRQALLRQLRWKYMEVAAHFTSATRRTATGRVAYLFLEIRERLRQQGAAQKASFECPFTQEEIGDALGLTPVHINRVLRQLRRDAVVTLANRRIEIHDLAVLRDLAQWGEEEKRRAP